MTGTFIQPIGQGKMLDRYCMLRLLGRGGMGEVWLAEDTGLHRQVALKILTPVMRRDDEYLKVFAHEAQLAAALEHPHILPVHDFGEVQRGDEIIPYLILPLIHGGSLEERLENNAQILSVEHSLKYLRQAAEAIDYAHSQSLLHRDIKPANMLLQEDDWLFLADFGLAKLLTTTTYTSHTHAGAGTPGYMSPEQIRGHAEKASDLYSLACVAYTLLTGREPFQGESVYAVLRQQLQDDPPPPQQFNPLLSSSMEQVLLKNLAKQPEARDSSCIQFIDELEYSWTTRHLKHLASNDPDATEIAPWNKRAIANQPATIESKISTFSLDTEQEENTNKPGEQHIDFSSPEDQNKTQPLSNVTTHIPEETNTASSKISQPETTKEHRFSRRELFIGGTATAIFLLGGSTALATGILKQGKRSGPQQLIQAKACLQLSGHSDAVESIKWHPSGRFLVTGSDDTHMMLWQIDTLLAQTTDHLQTVEQPATDWKFNIKFTKDSIDWSPDGQKLAFITNTEKTQDFGYPGEQNNAIAVMTIFQLHPPTTYYADDFTGARYRGSATIPANHYRNLNWSPTGKLLASIITGKDSVVQWSLNQASPIRYLDNTTPAKDQNTPIQFWSCDWSLNSTKMIVLDNELNILIWNLEKSGAIQLLPLPDRTLYLTGQKQPAGNAIVDKFTKVVASPLNPDQFAVSNSDAVAICDSQRIKVLRTLGIDDPEVHKNVTSPEDIISYPQLGTLAWSPNGRYIAGSYITNPRIFIWDLQNPHPIQKDGVELPIQTFDKNNGHRDIVLDMAWSPDGRYLATASQDNTVIIWQMDKS